MAEREESPRPRLVSIAIAIASWPCPAANASILSMALPDDINAPVSRSVYTRVCR